MGDRRTWRIMIAALATALALCVGILSSFAAPADALIAPVPALGDSPIATRGAPERLFHFTRAESAEAIAKQGLRPGGSGKVFLTPQGNLSPLQAQIDLALPPNRGLPNALFEVDVGKLRQLGIDVPAPSQVGRSFNMPGGGLEVPIDSRIPAEALRRLR